MHKYRGGQRASCAGQFLNTFPIEKRAWVRDKKCVTAGDIVDEYEDARQLDDLEKTNQQKGNNQQE